MYWHIYAGEIPCADTTIWHLVVTGPSDNAVPLTTRLRSGVHWVQTLNHRPTDDEKRAHTPREYRE